MGAEASVLIVSNFFSSYVHNRGVCEELAERLAGRGWAVVKTSSRRGRIARLLDMVFTALLQRHRYRLAQVDVFSGRSFLWAEAVCYTLRYLGKPYVLSLHSGDLPLFASASRKGRVSRLLRSAAVVTTPSHYLLEQMNRYRPDLVLLPNALDISIYHFRLRKSPQARLIWLRSFSHQAVYNPMLAVKVVQMLFREQPDIALTMVGSDNGDGSLTRFQQQVKNLDVAERIFLPGGVPKKEVPHCMNKGDIYLNTTNTDNTPVTVLEAMACGLCIISTNVGGIPYLLEHEHTALLVPPDDPAAMAGAVRRLLTEEGLAERLSHNARRKVEQFDWSTVLPQWEAILAGALQGMKNDRPR